MMRSQHIIALQENTLGGKDYIIGDIHGDRSFFKVLSDLQENDRLFCVGDLTDRGSANYEVVERIVQYQAQHPDRLYVVCGNHEEFCVNSIAFLEDMIDVFDFIPYEPDNTEKFEDWLSGFISRHHVDSLAQKFVCHMLSGGKWLVRLYKQELYDNHIKVVESDTEDGLKVEYTQNSRVGFIKSFMQALPYIILVEGVRPFTVAHADNPFDFAALKHKVVNKINLTVKEIDYVLNAREVTSDPFNNILIDRSLRSTSSILSYNGHNIVDVGKASVVRYAGNAVNTDIASFKTHVTLRVNHTDGTCQYFGDKVEKSMRKNPQLNEIKAELTKFLQAKLSKNIASSLESPGIDELEEQDAASRESLPPGKRSNAKNKRERVESHEDNKQQTPRNLSFIPGMTMYAAPNATQKELPDDYTIEQSYESPLKRKG